ncbi:protein HOMOLOG OF MAMMALIAN LYST-INTERACTING PROTEIN 5 [Spinacia oleracea]|uniref:Protein HOMOLOG OF MAMMALIAN LYST-INTERACTING PROTEIN 5 n=1 Tax=Spinacia oleracea TaxID=3562 RepID=A0A9R0JKY6_SPIOL|nr:protein HOMOLOG OF MAMMALIAN LYST-INTERACTING PROTEIN 5 [Spinacia oleracea]
MASDNEPAKQLLPYLQRADELQKHEPLVAYYCRLYAMERGLNIPQSERTKTTSSLLVSLMKQLEKDKKSLKLAPDDHLHLEGFALNVFAKADKQDRAGRADINTAKTFYAASIFFEILNQFGEIAPDLEQKQKYAAWKAADIRKALKEGRKPVPGPPGGEQDLSAPSSSPSGEFDVGPRQTGHDINPGPELDRTASSQFPDGLGRQPSTGVLPSSPSFPSDDYPSHSADFPSHTADYPPHNADFPSHTADYPSHDYQSGHGSGRTENPTYPQPPYRSQSYPQEPQNLPQVPQNYHSQDIPPPLSYPNFQSYPSFSESSLPAAPSHQPSYYQGSDASYSHQSSPSVTNYASAPQYSSSGRNGNVQDVPSSVQTPTSAQTYHYDSNYQPSSDKIAEAHKAARFAVGALAFDEVPVAVEHLRKALEYLTNPSAGQ